MQSVEYRTTGALVLGLGGLVVAASLLFTQQHHADALPAFAAQTGQPCTACHIGGFGPQLTPFGRAFKINGYTQGGGQGLQAHIPLSAMLQGSFTHTAKSLPDGSQPHTYDTNNNFAFDQASIFVAGRVSDHTGGFIQLTYNNVDNRTTPGSNGLSVDNTDLRPYTTTVQAFGNDLTLGVSVNNNPSVQDPYNSTFAWGYPYYGAGLAPTPGAASILAGTFAGNAIGVTAYAWYNEHLYLEAGGYEAMSPWLQNRFGEAAGGAPIVSSGLMPYLRAAYEWDWGNNAAWAGGTFMHAALNPLYQTGNDSYNDYAIDGGYEFLGTGKNIVTLQGIFVHEDQELKGTTANYNATNGTTYGSGNSLNTLSVNLAYWFENTYGLTLGWQRIWGPSSQVAYGLAGSNPISFNGKPNSNAFTIEADWVPFGQEKSLWRPWANVKLGLQYTLYTEFNGASSNYDGAGSNAGDNNTLVLYAWTAF